MKLTVKGTKPRYWLECSPHKTSRGKLLYFSPVIVFNERGRIANLTGPDAMTSGLKMIHTRVLDDRHLPIGPTGDPTVNYIFNTYCTKLKPDQIKALVTALTLQETFGNDPDGETKSSVQCTRANSRDKSNNTVCHESTRERSNDMREKSGKVQGVQSKNGKDITDVKRGQKVVSGLQKSKTTSVIWET